LEWNGNQITSVYLRTLPENKIVWGK